MERDLWMTSRTEGREGLIWKEISIDWKTGITMMERMKWVVGI